MGDNIGHRIRRARLRAGMRQAELAERCGVAERTVSDWETGKATPRNTVRIEEALGIALDDPPPEETVSVDTEDTDGANAHLDGMHAGEVPLPYCRLPVWSGG